jgi:hypothetical protein
MHRKRQLRGKLAEMFCDPVDAGSNTGPGRATVQPKEEGMFPRRKTRIGAAVVLAAALAIGLAAPAEAAGWSGWREVQDLADGFLPRVLAWLGFAPEPSLALKCDHGSSTDPNGCPKAADEDGFTEIRPALTLRPIATM